MKRVLLFTGISLGIIFIAHFFIVSAMFWFIFDLLLLFFITTVFIHALLYLYFVDAEWKVERFKSKVLSKIMSWLMVFGVFFCYRWLYMMEFGNMFDIEAYKVYPMLSGTTGFLTGCVWGFGTYNRISKVFLKR